MVNRYGSLARAFAFGGIEAQAELLAKEGVPCDENYIVDLKKYQWQEGLKW